MTGYDLEVIVLCNQGYSSSLVADTLRSLGLRRAVDVVGGFEAWAALGLPVVGVRRDGLTRPVTRPRPAAGGGRRLGVAPERLGPLAGRRRRAARRVRRGRLSTTASCG